VTGRFSRMRVFVTYRREDSAAYAGRLHDSLIDEFGDDHVFQDVSAIDPGEDFEVAIDSALDDADAALVVIGPRWLAPGAEGTPRLHDPDDYVRIEISKALARDIPVVPILVGGSTLPTAAELPDDLAPLTRRQAVQLRDTTWRDDVAGLIRRLRGETSSGSRTLKWVAAALVGLAAAGFAIWALIADGEDGASDEVTGCPGISGPDWISIFEGSEQVTVEGDEGEFHFEVTDVRKRQEDDGAWEIVLVSILTNNSTSGYEHDANRYEQLVIDGFPFDPVDCFTTIQERIEPGQRSEGIVGFYEVTREPETLVELVVRLGSGARANLPVPLTS
jgi:TIR domain